MPLVTVDCISLPAFVAAGLVGADEFRNARECIGEWRNFIAQRNQQIARFDALVAVAYGHRSVLAATRQFVRYETAIAKSPQELIKMFRGGLRHRVNMNSVLQPPGFFGQLASESVSRVFIDTIENIEIDLSHDRYQGRAPARDNRNSVSNDTGRPEAPFSTPDFQATPAISR